MSVNREDDAKKALEKVYGKEAAKSKFETLKESTAQEDGSKVQYKDMFTPGHAQFHPTMITVMGQINQALTGYGAVSGKHSPYPVLSKSLNSSSLRTC